jgi:hypothetical protein
MQHQMTTLSWQEGSVFKKGILIFAKNYHLDFKNQRKIDTNKILHVLKLVCEAYCNSNLSMLFFMLNVCCVERELCID